ncbi:unnamed protein product [Phytophthora fragariaefolia]|uniref:Unnamed protein product n=1 Tax=Phytophthora fragariaefolia TaxID=1490495 RepID=A0A9W6YDT9_9STRA|nr:unnamed protein product [Phytophthora fragariaefolia]
MKDALDARLQQCRAHERQQLAETFRRLAQHCVLLLQTRVVHKDLLTQAGLAYCLLLRVLLQLSAGEPALATKLLLQAAYPELQVVGLDKCADVQVRAHVEKDVESFGDLARLAVCRGLLNSLADEELALAAASLGLDEHQNADHSALDAIFTGVQQFCDQEAYNTRLYAFQVLEAFLRRAVGILQQHKKELASGRPAVLEMETLTNLTTAVLLNWEHPSKKVNQFMAAVFAHIVNYFVLSGGFQEWSDAILPRLVELPTTSRAKYGSLTLLVAEAGAKPVLEASPSLLSSLLSAVGQKDYAAPAAANLFAQILDDLSQGGGKKSGKNDSPPPNDESVTAWRLLWLPDVVGVLLSRDANLRSRVAMYVIPLLLKKDPDCVPVLVKRLQEEATTEHVDGEAADVALWAELEVLKFARKKMAPEKLVGVSMDEIERGLQHAKVETRGTAFDALCASLKSTSMPTDEELRLVKYYLVVNGKEIGPAGRMNTLIGLKTVLVRIKETMRLASKNQAKPNTSTPIRDDYAAAVSFKHWVELFVVTSVYPGALPQRLTLGLEVLLLYVQLFGFGNDEAHAKSPTRSLLLTGQMVTTLLNMLISAWDSIRSLAFTVLDLYPDELPGYSTREQLRTLVDWAVGLCGSPRQRESDAGAMFIRLLFQKCSKSIQRFGLAFQRALEHQSDAVDASSKNAEVAFVLQLTQVILSRVEALSPAEIRRGESPLVHGFLLSLHYVLENVDFDKLSESEAVQWQHAMTQIFMAVHQSMRASLAVVGDATSGTGDEELSASFAGVVGEVSAVAKTANSALRVDCRGHLIVEKGESGIDGEEEDGNAEQRAVVGSWLAARECGAILELLMRRVPLPSSNPAPGVITYFTVEMAQRGGETLLNSLFELKHKGAVATAYQAFEGVCRAFLAHGEQNSVLGGLPSRWADRLLERLEKSEQHFILRRSSGFAFSFVAILRAEPRNSAAVILPKVMSTLLRLAGEDTDAAEKRDTHQEHHSLWRARVHALNILKLICQDGVLAEDVARYVVDMFELAVRGFDCGSWAVRNSSMMLFAAATQRAIGDKRIADGGTRQQVSSDDVFSRFQQLRGFLARELSRLLKDDSKPSALGGAAPPGLYPLLLFLCRLRPGDEDDQRVADVSASPSEDGSGLAGFVPLVMKCASQPTMAIRHMAAKVVASIVSDADAASVLSMLCAKLPQGIRNSKGSKGMSHNYVHGVLTQIRHLTTKYLFVGEAQRKSTPISMDTQAEFFETVATKLISSTMWLWAGQDTGSINATIRAELVATVDVVLRYYVENTSAALATLKTGSTRAAFAQVIVNIQAEVEHQLLVRCDSDRTAAVLLSTRPGMYVLDRALVSIWFSLWTMPASGQQLHPLVQKMLVSDVLQIRKKAIKKFANKLVVADLNSESIPKLQTILIGQLMVETHPKVRARQLQLLVHCQVRQPITGAQPQREQLETKLAQTLNISADNQVLAPALELIALLAYHSSSSANQDSKVYQILNQEIESRSDENQPLILREAAASALHHSRLLLLHTNEGSVTSTADLALSGWMSALRLLQDDSARVRSVARHAVQEALASVKAHGSSSSRDSLSDATVLPLAVEYVATSFARTAHGTASLSKVLFELVDAPSVLAAYAGAAGVKAQDWDDLYRRIFESESSNYFAERDVLVQNIVFSLLARSAGDRESVRLLRQQVLTAVASALTTLNQEAQREESSQWLGGITYYSDVFAPLFGLLSAGVTALTSISASPEAELQPLVEQVRGLAENAYDIHRNSDATHPLLLRALEFLASKDQDSWKQTGTEPVTELLYLTPHWTALGDSSAN